MLRAVRSNFAISTVRARGYCVPGHRQRLLSYQLFPRYPQLLEPQPVPGQRILRKDRIPEARFHQPFDHFGIVRIHRDAGPNTQFSEIPVDQCAHVALRRKEKERDALQFGSLNGFDPSAAGFFVLRPDYQKFFIVERHDGQIRIIERQGDDSQIVIAVEKAGDDLLGGCDADVQVGMRIALAQHPQRSSHAVNQRCGAGREVKGMPVKFGRILEILPQIAGFLKEIARMHRQTLRGGCGNDVLARPDEQLGLQLGGQMFQLKADRARRNVKPRGGAGYRAMFHDSEKYFELTQVHDLVVGIHAIKTV